MTSSYNDAGVQALLEILQEGHGRIFPAWFRPMVFQAAFQGIHVLVLDYTDFLLQDSLHSENFFKLKFYRINAGFPFEHHVFLWNCELMPARIEIRNQSKLIMNKTII